MSCGAAAASRHPIDCQRNVAQHPYDIGEERRQRRDRAARPASLSIICRHQHSSV
jgi:hypothetical protein